MLETMADAVIRRPLATLAGLLVAFLAFLAIAVTGIGELALGPTSVADSQSLDAARQAREGLGHEGSPSLVILTRGDTAVSSGIYRIALSTISSQLRSNPAIGAVERGPVSPDKQSTSLQIFFRTSDPGVQQRVTQSLEREVDAGPLKLSYAGRIPNELAARDAVSNRLPRLALLAAPLVLLVLIGVLGLRLAAAPLLAAAVAVAGCLAAMRIAGLATPVALVAAAPGAALGITLGVELPVLLAWRYREEAWSFGRGEPAVRRCLSMAGRPAVLAGLGAAAACGALGLLPVNYARAMAFGGAVSALIATAAALFATTALLTLFGGSLREYQLPLESIERGGPLYRVAAALAADWRRALAVAIVALAAGLVLGAPAIGVRALGLGPRDLPANSAARTAAASVAHSLGPGQTAPLIAAARGPRPAVGRYRARLAKVPGVGDAGRLQRLLKHGFLVTAHLSKRTATLPARRVVERARGLDSPLRPDVGGGDATVLDAATGTAGRLALVVAVGLVVLVALLLAVGSPRLLAIPVALTTLVPAAAAAGAMVFVFQDGRFAPTLGYEPGDAVNLGALLVATLATWAISAARSIAAGGTLAAERGPGFPPRRTVTRALVMCTPAAAVATIVTGALVAASGGVELTPAREASLGLVVGLLADLVLVRFLLGPALARLGERDR